MKTYLSRYSFDLTFYLVTRNKDSEESIAFPLTKTASFSHYPTGCQDQSAITTIATAATQPHNAIWTATFSGGRTA